MDKEGERVTVLVTRLVGWSLAGLCVLAVVTYILAPRADEVAVSAATTGVVTGEAAASEGPIKLP